MTCHHPPISPASLASMDSIAALCEFETQPYFQPRTLLPNLLREALSGPGASSQTAAEIVEIRGVAIACVGSDDAAETWLICHAQGMAAMLRYVIFGRGEVSFGAVMRARVKPDHRVESWRAAPDATDTPAWVMVVEAAMDFAAAADDETASGDDRLASLTRLRTLLAVGVGGDLAMALATWNLEHQRGCPRLYAAALIADPTLYQAVCNATYRMPLSHVVHNIGFLKDTRAVRNRLIQAWERQGGANRRHDPAAALLMLAYLEGSRSLRNSPSSLAQMQTLAHVAPWGQAMAIVRVIGAVTRPDLLRAAKACQPNDVDAIAAAFGLRAPGPRDQTQRLPVEAYRRLASDMAAFCMIDFSRSGQRHPAVCLEAIDAWLRTLGFASPRFSLADWQVHDLTCATFACVEPAWLLDCGEPDLLEAVRRVARWNGQLAPFASVGARAVGGCDALAGDVHCGDRPTPWNKAYLAGFANHGPTICPADRPPPAWVRQIPRLLEAGSRDRDGNILTMVSHKLGHHAAAGCQPCRRQLVAMLTKTTQLDHAHRLRRLSLPIAESMLSWSAGRQAVFDELRNGTLPEAWLLWHDRFRPGFVNRAEPVSDEAGSGDAEPREQWRLAAVNVDATIALLDQFGYANRSGDGNAALRALSIAALACALASPTPQAACLAMLRHAEVYQGELHAARRAVEASDPAALINAAEWWSFDVATVEKIARLRYAAETSLWWEEWVADVAARGSVVESLEIERLVRALQGRIAEWTMATRHHDQRGPTMLGRLQDAVLELTPYVINAVDQRSGERDKLVAATIGAMWSLTIGAAAPSHQDQAFAQWAGKLLQSAARAGDIFGTEENHKPAHEAMLEVALLRAFELVDAAPSGDLGSSYPLQQLRTQLAGAGQRSLDRMVRSVATLLRDAAAPSKSTALVESTLKRAFEAAKEAETRSRAIRPPRNDSMADYLDSAIGATAHLLGARNRVELVRLDDSGRAPLLTSLADALESFCADVDPRSALGLIELDVLLAVFDGRSGVAYDAAPVVVHVPRLPGGAVLFVVDEIVRNATKHGSERVVIDVEVETDAGYEVSLRITESPMSRDRAQRIHARLSGTDDASRDADTSGSRQGLGLVRQLVSAAGLWSARCAQFHNDCMIWTIPIGESRPFGA